MKCIGSIAAFIRPLSVKSNRTCRDGAQQCCARTGTSTDLLKAEEFFGAYYQAQREDGDGYFAYGSYCEGF
jgi:hypothetical protein